MGRKKKSNDPYKSIDGFNGGDSSFTRFYYEMALSPTYQKLSDKAKVTLEMCKLCRKFHQGNYAIGGDPLKFYFNRELQKRFGLGNPNKVRASMIELVKNGFIEVVECNWNRKCKNVYRYSTKWHLLDEGIEIELSDSSKTFIAGKN